LFSIDLTIFLSIESKLPINKSFISFLSSLFNDLTSSWPPCFNVEVIFSNSLPLLTFLFCFTKNLSLALDILFTSSTSTGASVPEETTSFKYPFKVGSAVPIVLDGLSSCFP